MSKIISASNKKIDLQSQKCNALKNIYLKVLIFPIKEALKLLRGPPARNGSLRTIQTIQVCATCLNLEYNQSSN